MLHLKNEKKPFYIVCEFSLIFNGDSKKFSFAIKVVQTFESV